jgi:transcriptional regulator with XRE-family HTH domain
VQVADADEAAAVGGEREPASASSKKPNLMDLHVGSRVRLRRMMLGMSQEKLGERMGLTFQQIQKYERGINRIGASRLYELARVLQVQVQFFYDEAPPGNGPAGGLSPGFGEAQAESSIVEFLGSRDGLELNRAFLRIKDAKVRRSIVELVRALASDGAAGDGAG